jgi:hypothetical protein
MSKKVILHIGFQKTGSSALQSCFSENMEVFSRQNIEYPLPSDSKLKSHQELAWMFIKEKMYSVDEVLEYYSNAIASSDKDVVILSSEDLSLIRAPERVKLLKEHFSANDVQVVVYLREPLDFLLSMYHYKVRRGNELGSFMNYLLQQNMNMVNYTKRLAPWRKFFGIKNVIVRKYSPKDFVGGNIVSDFMSAIDVSYDNSIEPDRRNAGTHPLMVSPYQHMLSSGKSGKELHQLTTRIKQLSETLPKIDAAEFYLGSDVSKVIRKILNKLNVEFSND